MARKEWTPENWKWDEEKIAVYLEKFKEYLSSTEGKKELEIGKEKKLKMQKFLEDEESIDKLSIEELKELLLMVNTIRTYEDKIKPKKKPITSEIDKGNIEYINQIKDWLKELIKIKEGDSLPKSPKNCSAKAASELLTFRYPEKFYIVNGACIKGLNELRLDNIPELNESDVNENNYPNWRPLFEYLKDKISKVIKGKLDKETDYYDVDVFLYFIGKQIPKLKNNKTDESQDKSKESMNIAETVKESDTKNELTLQGYLQYRGFYFDQDLITAFYSALKTKGFVILSGLTGTGKTKLAQLFADLFLEEKSKESSETNDSSMNGFIIKVQHYMLQHNRMYIPTNYLHFLGSTDVKQGVKVKVVINDEEEICRLVEYTNSPVALYFNKKVAEWFKNNLKKEDQLLVKIELSEDNQVEKFILQNVETETNYFPTYTFLSVRPDWRDTKELLGYYNPINRAYESTPLLKFILEAKESYEDNKNNAVPYFIILDEVNLSHVEYYFADFLSVLESGRDQHGWTKETIKLHNSEEVLLDNNGKEIPKEIKLPPNLYIIGSVNIDETTYMFSPKVLDRVFTIEFREVNFDNYSKSLQNLPINISEDELKTLEDQLKKLGDILLNDLRNNEKFCAVVADKKEIKNAISKLDSTIINELNQLNQILQPYNLHFGYRVLDEIALFIKYATSAPKEVGELSVERALDFAVFMKVLPKFHGPRQKLERPLWLVLNWCLVNPVEFDNKKSENLIKEIWKKLKENWKELKGKESPSIDDIFFVIQELRLELKNIKKESQVTNTELQTINQQEKQTTEENEQAENVAQQAEQTKATSKGSFKYSRTAIKVLTMLRQLYETGFASFA